MTDRLDEIRKRLGAATPGPWHIERMKHSLKHSEIWLQPEDEHAWSLDCNTYQPNSKDEANAQLIAHAPEDIAYLLAEVERLQADLQKAYQEQYKAHVRYFEDKILGDKRPS